jgi:hypothetical protein
MGGAHPSRPRLYLDEPDLLEPVQTQGLDRGMSHTVLETDLLMASQGAGEVMETEIPTACGCQWASCPAPNTVPSSEHVRRLLSV